MTPSDKRRLSRLLDAVEKASDALADAQLRGIIGEWKGSTGQTLKTDLDEFHDWHAARMAREAA